VRGESPRYGRRATLVVDLNGDAHDRPYLPRRRLCLAPLRRPPGHRAIPDRSRHPGRSETRVRRVFALVNRRTDIVRRIEATIGDRYAGVYDGIEKDSTYASVLAAKNAAAEGSADMLIAVGGGSVIVATRAVAIFMAEPGDPFQLMTQYPEGKPAYSPRLLAPKPPIVNIPTTPNSAMNRAGTGLKNPDLDHRMEYFDPRTRPHSIFLDNGALLSAPPGLIRSTATTVFAGLVGSMAQLDMNPLAQGDRDHAFRLAHRAYPRLVDELDNPSLRIDLCIAAFLQNRAEDDGSRRFRGGAFSGNYAVSTALHVRYPHVGQGESTSVVHAAKIRLSEQVDPRSARQVAEALASGMATWTPDRPRSPSLTRWRCFTCASACRPGCGN